MNLKALEALRDFNPRPCDQWLFDVPVFRQQLETKIMLFPSYVLPSVEKPVAICGIEYGNGVGAVWLVTGVGFERQAPIIARQLRELCKAAYQTLNLNRIHMTVDSANPQAQRFAERLGFVCEARSLKAMGARGEDLDIYFFERNDQWDH